MSALTSLIRLSTSRGFWWTSIASFFIAVSEVEPLISHVDALVDALEDSNPEKQCFRILVGLAKAVILSCHRTRNNVSDGFAHDIRSRLIRLLRAYRYVLFLMLKKAEVT